MMPDQPKNDPTWSTTIQVGDQYVTLNVYQKILAAEEDQLKDLIASIKRIMIETEEKQATAVPGGKEAQKKVEKSSSEKEESASGSSGSLKRQLGGLRHFLESLMQARYHRNDIEANKLREDLGIEPNRPVYNSPKHKAEAEKRQQEIEKVSTVSHETAKPIKKPEEKQHGPEKYQSFHTFINHGPMLLWAMELFKENQTQDLISRALHHDPVLGVYIPNVEQTTGYATVFFKKDDLDEFRAIMRSFTEEKLKMEKAAHLKAEGLTEDEDRTGTDRLTDRIAKINHDAQIAREGREKAERMKEEKAQKKREADIAKQEQDAQNQDWTEDQQNDLDEANDTEIIEEAGAYDIDEPDIGEAPDDLDFSEPDLFLTANSADDDDSGGGE